MIMLESELVLDGVPCLLPLFLLWKGLVMPSNPWMAYALVFRVPACCSLAVLSAYHRGRFIHEQAPDERKNCLEEHDG